MRASTVSKEFAAPDGSHTQVLNGVSFEAAAGDFTVIVGPSGSGKSTLLHCLAGLERPTSGEAFLDGVNLNELTPRARARAYRKIVGFVFQNYNLIDSLSAWENVALPFRLDGRRPEVSRVDAALTVVGLASKRKRLPSQLSGGEQQRVAIARAICSEPAVLLTDEPTGALDDVTAQFVFDQLKRIAANGAAVVTVTHDLVAAERADRVIVMRSGHILYTGLPIPATEITAIFAAGEVSR
ncbi:ABC transporter ATP-binding protein [Luethyella okanaganae]|uniref:ABC transporter ATP-binding protein n=1 Tax=Luethyella okanaganae TaxID=69372 RepID=A0ABW1VK53_9MICO